MKILHAVGTRPNFIKAAPVIREIQSRGASFNQVLVHTGQHYDTNMSELFFRELGLPDPDEFLNSGPGSHAQQTARILQAFEPVLEKRNPDWVVVYGDVNSTLACALASAKIGINVAHVEAGLRCGDRKMPEEINRVLTDQVSELLFTPSADADANLIREGIAPGRIHFVGNVMIDSLVTALQNAPSRNPDLSDRSYILVTLHRPRNVDSPERLREIAAALSELSRKYAVVFPVHPRTNEQLRALDTGRTLLLEPLGRLEFVAWMRGAGLVITDSGGVQEETTFLGVPCLTLRPSTERPITIERGTNQLVASECEAILLAADTNFGRISPPASLPFWDGLAAKRIVDVFAQLI